MASDQSKWRWAESIGFGGLLACVLYAILCFGAVRSLEFSVLSAAVPLTLICVLLHLIHRPDSFRSDKWFWVAAGFLAYVAWRAFASPARYDAIGDLLLFTLYLMVGLAANVLLGTDRRRCVFFGLVFAVGIAGCFVSVYQSIGDRNWVWGLSRPETYSGRASGFYVNPNHWAGFLGMVFFLSLTVFMLGCRSILFRVFSGYTALMAITGIALTQSRMALFSTAFVSLGMFLALFFKRGVPRWVPSSAGIALVILAAGIWFGSPSLQQRVHNLVTQNNTIRDFRPEIWRSAFCVWKKDPWFGVGPNQFKHEFRSCRSEWLMRNPVRAHCDYLNILVDLGIVGFIWVAGWFGCLSWQVVRMQRVDWMTPRSRNRETSGLGNWQFASSLALSVLLVHSFADFNLFIPANGILASTLIGLLLLEPTSPARADQNQRRKLRPARMLLVALMVVVAGCVLGEGVRRFGGAYWTLKARNSDTYALRVEQYGRAMLWTPESPQLLAGLAECHRMRSFLGEEDYVETAETAMVVYQELIQILPKDPYARVGLGMCLDWLGRSDDAGGYFEQAYQLDPNNKAIVAMQGWHAFQRNDYRSAADWFDKARRMPHAADPVAESYAPLVSRRLQEAN